MRSRFSAERLALCPGSGTGSNSTANTKLSGIPQCQPSLLTMTFIRWLPRCWFMNILGKRDNHRPPHRQQDVGDCVCDSEPEHWRYTFSYFSHGTQTRGDGLATTDRSQQNHRMQLENKPAKANCY